VRIAVVTGFAIFAMAASVLYTSGVQRTTAEKHASTAQSTQSILTDVYRGDSALASFVLTGDPQQLEERDQALAQLRAVLATAARSAGNDRVGRALVAGQRRLVAQLAAIEAVDLRATSVARQRQALSSDSNVHRALVERIASLNARLRARQSTNADREDQHASLVAPALIVMLGLIFGSAALLAVRRARRDAQRRTRDRARQERFGEAMQASDGQVEAHGLLKSHLERSIDAATITVLNRNNSADRLEASTPLDEDAVLAERLAQARPRSCMAVRLSRQFTQGPDSDEVLTCQVCGGLDSGTTCQPLLVGGEVIGAVLTEHGESLTAGDQERIAQSVAQSAPVLANLRNLAIAETRAATDALTGLPNRRAVDDTLLRMLAQAGRSFNPLSVILLDLDHFKQINDTHGHDRGDEVLAAFGARLREVLRDSDFAGRSGGEEFVLFLPGTDRTGAVRLAEKVREVMRGLRVSGVDRDVTASFGVACFPDDAVDAQALMRSADRALYAAKRGGRDRIEASSTGAPPTAADSREAARNAG